MKSPRTTIELSASDVEQAIKDLSLLVVSMDRIGSKYYDDLIRRAAAEEKYFSEINAFKILAGIRGVLEQACELQSSKEDVTRLEETRGGTALLAATINIRI